MPTVLPKHELSYPDPALNPYLARPIHEDMNWMYEYFRAPVIGAYAHICDLLTDEALGAMSEIPVSENSKYRTAELLEHPVAGPLIHTMAKISLMNPLAQLDPKKMKVSLRHESGEDISLTSHRDLLDGHAVIFNFDVVGSLYYVINGQRVILSNNELIAINGAHHIQDVSRYVTEANLKAIGCMTAFHSVAGIGFTSRKRLLVFADGIETTVNQITE